MPQYDIENASYHMFEYDWNIIIPLFIMILIFSIALKYMIDKYSIPQSESE